MKVLIYGVNYAPELTGIGKYSGEMAEWLASHGHEVRVVTAPPYYPEWKVGDGYSAAGYRFESKTGVSVWRCPLYVPAQPSGLKRILHLASFAISSLPVMIRQLFWRPDVVSVIEPPLFCAPTAWLTARLSGAKCWLHIQDFEVDAAFDLGIIKGEKLKSFVSAIESWLMRRFDVVSTISKSMLQRLSEKGIEEPVLFPNWADLSRIRFDESGRESFRSELALKNGHKLCLYSGNIAVKQGLEILLEVAPRLPGCHFLICGDGANRQALQEKAADISNISFLPLQPLERLSAMLSAADIHLVIQKAGAADLVMPSKLTNILAVGGVAIATAEAESELGQLACGEEPSLYRCDPENADALVEAISALNESPELSDRIRTHAKAYADSHIAMDQVLSAFERRLKATVIGEL
ncbi:MAG: glycosyltransferase WbuB [Zetaproteobacteria bacterium]|nr:glycosyltransferase WbuB [Zetaproteobacteria bacterium]